MDGLVAPVRFVLRREATAHRGLALGHLFDERLVRRPLITTHALQQRGEEELGIRHALVVAVVA